jgi:nucleoside-diphosphate-sugar epimerase
LKYSIYLAGASGFLGQNFIQCNQNYDFVFFEKGKGIDISYANDIVLNFVGKAHDLKKISNEEAYRDSNVEFTKKIFSAFLSSSANTFIHLSSIKACADYSDEPIDENLYPNPSSIYGVTKLEAEQYLLAMPLPEGKRLIIIRPTMIYGPGVKGNFRSLIKWVNSGFPWPFTQIKNQRNLCSIYTLIKFIRESIENKDVASGIYHVCDSRPISSNDIISIISEALEKKIIFLKIPLGVFKFLSKIGNFIPFSPITEEKLGKIDSNFLVNNDKMKHAFRSSLNENPETELLHTVKSFLNK